MRNRLFAVLGLTALGSAGAAPPAAAQVLSFTDVTASAGVTFTHVPSPGATPMSSGGAAADFNRDGFMDLFVIGGGGVSDALFINDGDGTFTNQAGAWGLSGKHRGGGMAVGDYDKDGYPDLYVQSHGPALSSQPGQHKLYRNVGGQFFVNVAAAAGVTTTSPVVGDGFGATFGDIDLDGDLDLVSLGWIDATGGNHIYRNNGNGTFTDITVSAAGGAFAPMNGFTPHLCDMNGDRYPELLLANDFGTLRYLVNDGDGTFTDATAASGTTQYCNGMGAAIADFDGDLNLDWYVTAIWEDGGCSSGNLLYMGSGADTFTQMAGAAGCGDGGWGWGTLAADLDNDGDRDLVETNGFDFPLTNHAEPNCSHPTVSQWIGEQSYVWINDGRCVFTESAAALGVTYADDGRGLLTFDYDNDGDQDLAFFTFQGPLVLYRNNLSGPGTHRLRILLEEGGKPGVAPDGYGAQVYLTSGGETQLQAAGVPGTYVSQNEPALHFGLGSAAVADELRVAWPDGTVTYLEDVPADQTLTVTHHGWKALAGALAGTGGLAPSLSGQGEIALGRTVTLSLTQGKPFAPASLVLGISILNAPFKGGTLVPSVNVLFSGLATNAAGGLAIGSPWPSVLPSGTALYFQYWLVDAGGPQGLSASNAVQLTTP